MRKRILITGGSGFVGGHLLSRANRDWEVFTTFRSSPVPPKGVRALSLDLENGKEVREMVEKIQPGVIIHTAAWSDLDGCEEDRDRAFRINAEATGIFAEKSAELGCRFIYTSSDMAFDGEKGNYSESDRIFPINVYGESKIAGEDKIRKVCTNYVVCRVALVYGSPVTGSNSFSEKILQSVRRGDVMPLFTDQYRSPILVQNLTEALLELAGMGFTGTIHLGGMEKVDRYTFGLRLAEVKKFSADLLKPISMSEFHTVAPRPRDVSLDISKAGKLLETQLLGCHEGLKQA